MMRGKWLFVGMAAMFLFAIAAIGARPSKKTLKNDISHFKVLGKAGIPHMINYQGYLTDVGGNPINDTLKMTFSIWDALSGGSQLWSETQSEVIIIDGLFDVLLGSEKCIPGSVFSDPMCWLETQIQSEILDPRKEFASVGYAFRADTADYAITAPTDNDWEIDGNDMYSIPVGNVGIGTTDPQGYKFAVNGGDGVFAGGNLRVQTVSLGGAGGYYAEINGNEIRGGGVAGPGNNPIHIKPGDNQSAILLAEDGGNVGIGTTDPQDYKLAVNEGDGVIAGGKLRVQTVSLGGAGGYYAEIDGNEIKGGGVAGPGNNPIHIKPGDNLSDVLLAEDGGNVGIGTANPIRRLDVAGQINAVDYYRLNDKVLTYNSGGTFYHGWDVSVTKHIIATGGTERLVIDNSGNVGIGTTDPGSYKLAVNDGDGVIAGGNLRVQTVSLGGAGGYYAEIDGNEIRGGGVAAPGNNPIHIKPGDNQSDILLAEDGGNVGIGTTDPESYKLAVNDGDGVIAGGKLRVQTVSLGGAGGYYAEIDGNEIRGGGVAAPGNNPIHIKPGDNQSAILLAEDGGNVGIGTTGPNYRLDVAGDINTTGDVRKNGTAYNNPDYVFEPGYALMSLKDLKEFIAEKKHLPDMPSTEEVRKEGVKIFEQNRLLLEKLEEAYLYIIELEERISNLEEAEVSHNVRQ